MYAKLRALAWGEPTFKMELEALLRETGLTRTRLFEYARLLRLSNALLWHCADSVFECSFMGDGDESRNPVKRDLPINTSLDSYREGINTEVGKSKNPGKRDSGIRDETLRISTQPYGEVLIFELTKHYDSKKRRTPEFFANPQQRDAYAEAYRALGGQWAALVNKGIARHIVALNKLLGWLEGCAKKSQATATAERGGEVIHNPDGSYHV